MSDWEVGTCIVFKRNRRERNTTTKLSFLNRYLINYLSTPVVVRVHCDEDANTQLLAHRGFDLKDTNTDKIKNYTFSSVVEINISILINKIIKHFKRVSYKATVNRRELLISIK